MGLAATVLARAATAARPARSLGAPPLSTVKTHSASRRGRSLGRGKLTLRDTSCSERVKEAVREGRAAAISLSRPHLIGKTERVGMRGGWAARWATRVTSSGRQMRLSVRPTRFPFISGPRTCIASQGLVLQVGLTGFPRSCRAAWTEAIPGDLSRNRVLYSMSVSTAGTSRSHAASLRCVQQCTRMALEVWQAAADLVAWSPSHV